MMIAALRAIGFRGEMIVAARHEHQRKLAKDLGAAFSEINAVGCNFYLSSVK